MTNEEAIQVVTTLLYNQTRVMGNNQREGVFMAIEALKKQMPMKAIKGFKCPVCGETTTYWYNYCYKCGQRISWKDVEK